MLKFCFSLYIISLAFGCLVACVRFAFDAYKWHDREELTVITPSAEDQSEEVLENE